MRDIKLNDTKANTIRAKLEHSGYRATPKVMYVRYSKSRGDSAFIHHSLNVIRCRRNTDASAAIESVLGGANGKAPDSQDTGEFLTWFLNGYQGKSTTRAP